MADYNNTRDSSLPDPASPGFLDGDTITLQNGSKFSRQSGRWEPVRFQTVGQQSKEMPVFASTSDQGIKKIPQVSVCTIQSGIPFVIPPGTGAAGLNFTAGGNGAFILSAAPLAGLGAVISDCYIRLPANAGGSGCADGWYYCKFSSDIAGTVYANTYTSGRPVIPAAPTQFFGSPSGYITTLTTEITALQGYVLEANTLGLDGHIRLLAKVLGDTAATKNYRVRLGGAQVLNLQTSSSPVAHLEAAAHNAGRADRQNVTRVASALGVQSAAINTDTTAVDTSVDQAVTMTMQLSNNSGCAVLASFVLSVVASE